MAIAKYGSRYSRAKIYGVTRELSGGVVETRLYVAPTFRYPIDLDDRFDLVPFSTDLPIDAMARARTGDEQDWWVVAHVSDIVDPLDLAAGQVLVIPSITLFRDLT